MSFRPLVRPSQKANAEAMAEGETAACVAQHSWLEPNTTFESIRNIVDVFNDMGAKFKKAAEEYHDDKVALTYEPECEVPGCEGLKGKDIPFIGICLVELKDVIQELMEADEVHLLSSPYDGDFSGPTLKAWQIKQDLKKKGAQKQKRIFVFDPSTEMETFALSRLYGEKLQSSRWLEIWAELALVVKEMRTRPGNESAFHFLCCKEPPAEKENGDYDYKIWEKTGLKGNAQHGELRIALVAGATSKANGMHFHQYVPQKKPSSTESQAEEKRKETPLSVEEEAEKKRRETKLLHRFLAGCGIEKDHLEIFAQGGELQVPLRYQRGPGKELPAALAKNFRRLSKIPELDLKSCASLLDLPEGIVHLQLLKKLILTNCFALSKLPKHIGRLKALMLLDLTNCYNLTELTEGIGDLQALEELCLEECRQLRALPKSTQRLLSLKLLNCLGCKSLMELPDGTRHLKSLKRLVLQGSSLRWLPNGIGDLQKLQHLELRWCRLLTALPEGLLQIKSLQTVDLVGCDSLTLLPKGLERFDKRSDFDINRYLDSFADGRR